MNQDARRVRRTRLERQLTLNQLRIFRTVVDEAGFTRAAEALALSQPAVSHQVQALARAVGRALLQPGRGSTELTAAGRALYEGAGRLLLQLEETDRLLDDLEGLRRGSVAIAGDTTVSVHVLPDALAAFHDAHVEIDLGLQVVNRAAVRDLLVRAEADLGVLAGFWNDERLESRPLLDNEFRCYTAPGHPLARREPLSCADLAAGPLLLREPGSGTREAVDAVLLSRGVDPAPAMEMASNGALKRAVAGGLGVTIVSVHAVQMELALGLLRPLEVEGFPVRRTWHVAWSRERLLSRAATAFRDFLLEPAWRSSLPVRLAAD